MTNKCTIISQIITFLHVLTPLRHPQYIPGQHNSSIYIQTVYTATTDWPTS